MTRDWARLGGAIRAAYQAMHLNQREFYEMAGISRSTMRRLEAGTGPEPSSLTLSRVERALGWPAGAAAAVAEGASPPQPGPVTEHRVQRPAALSDPALVDRLPADIREELRAGEVLGVDVVTLGPTEAGARMIVVVKRDADGEPDPEALRAALEEWRRRRDMLRRRDT